MLIKLKIDYIIMKSFFSTKLRQELISYNELFHTYMYRIVFTDLNILRFIG